MNACYRVHRCCILMVTSASLKDATEEDRQNQRDRLLSLSSSSHRGSSIRTWDARTRKVRSEICLILLERHSRASPIVSCILQQRSYREYHAIREIDIGFEFDWSGRLTFDSL